MIIFGFRGLKGRKATGVFYCPVCQGDRNYVRFGYRRWFTLFFIPVFPVSGLRGDAVRCETCQRAFQPSVLDMPQSDQFSQLVGNAFRECALATLKSGNVGDPHARSVALAAIRGHLADGSSYIDSMLDPDLAEIDVTQTSVFVSPVAARLSPDKIEEFVTSCAMIAVADGPLSDSEQTTVRGIATSFNLSPTYLAGIVQAATKNVSDQDRQARN